MVMKIRKAQVVIPAHTPFPWDMLRYECCWPAKEGDTGSLGNLGACPDIRTIEVHKYSDQTCRSRDKHTVLNAHWRPDRWKSMGVLLEPFDEYVVGDLDPNLRGTAQLRDILGE